MKTVASAADDSAQFNKVATGGDQNNGPAQPPRTNSGATAKKGAPTLDDDFPAGAFVQYARVGPGFIPTTATVAKLEAAIYHIEYCEAGPFLVPHRLVTDELLRLPDSKSDGVIAEIERFWTLKGKYQQYGLTYKRGFLLFGPPGSGKTCTVDIVLRQVVAQGGLAVVVGSISPSDVTLLLRRHRQVEPERPLIVILEDIDAYIKSYGESSVLSILDGEDSIDNVVYIATTNYPENLDGRVINRPSRFDRVIHVDTPNAEARFTYLKSRNTGLDDQELRVWANETGGLSISHLKELVIGVVILGGKLENEVERLRGMAKTPKSSDGKTGTGFRLE